LLIFVEPCLKNPLISHSLQRLILRSPTTSPQQSPPPLPSLPGLRGCFDNPNSMTPPFWSFHNGPAFFLPPGNPMKPGFLEDSKDFTDIFTVIPHVSEGLWYRFILVSHTTHTPDITFCRFPPANSFPPVRFCS